jgi:drug/metabolite transporter (DMT)-like permease
MALEESTPDTTVAGLRTERLALLAVVGSVSMWGYSAVAIKTVSTTAPITSFYRLWFAIPLLWLLVLGVPQLRRSLTREWLLGSLLGGIVFATHQIFFFTSVKLTTIANATIIGALQPVLVLLVAAPLFGERTSMRSTLLSLVAIGGTGLVVWDSVGEAGAGGRGDLLALLNLFAFTAYFLISKRVRRSVGATEYVVGMSTVAGIVMGLVCLALGEEFGSPKESDLLILLLLALGPGTFGHVLTNWAHAHASALSISMILLAVPVVATASAAVFLGESVTGVQMGGFAIVLGAIALVVADSDPKATGGLAESAAQTDAT